MNPTPYDDPRAVDPYAPWKWPVPEGLWTPPWSEVDPRLFGLKAWPWETPAAPAMRRVPPLLSRFGMSLAALQELGRRLRVMWRIMSTDRPGRTFLDDIPGSPARPYGELGR